MPTSVSVFEYGANAAVVGMVSVSIPVDPMGVWDSCMSALQAMVVSGKMGYKSSQTDKSVARPNAWSGPATNLGAAAQTTKWKPGCLQQPHVHLGTISERAVIGCVLTPAAGGTTYLTMNIYIGQSS